MPAIDTCRLAIAGAASSALRLTGTFTLRLASQSFAGVAVFERSLDGGTTYAPVAYPDGAPVRIVEPQAGGTAWTGTGAGWSMTMTEPNQNALYRMRLTEYVSGALLVTVSA